jgi:4-hydroxybenzoate polyprenyltransferase
LGILIFSLCASAIYVLNDLLDVEADRKHPEKRHRPFASGALPITYGVPLACVLAIGGMTLAILLLSHTFAAAVGIYLFLAILYSFWAKRKPIADVILLSSLYTLRVLAGGFVAGVIVSEWLLAFSLFLFTSLAFLKRYTELSRLCSERNLAFQHRGYLPPDLKLIETLGPVSGYLAVLVLALYLNSDTVRRLYIHPDLLWLICPLLQYWISRVWLLAQRQQLSEDPVVFAFQDGFSWTVGTIAAVLLAGAAIRW